jgi:transposase-like protein
MTDDEICGAECADGTPCEHPAGSCPVSSHTGDSSGAGGRPSKFDEDRKADILQAARNGTTVEGCARAAGIHHSTLYEWLDEYPEFSEAFERARAKGEQRLVEDVVDEDPKFILERSYDYVKTERREIEADVDQTTTHELGEDDREFALETIRELQESDADE